MQSFCDHGHKYILYSYDNVEVPIGVDVMDAAQIIPRDRLFIYGDKAGVGQGSVAGFSNRFRYELLHRFGDWWVDTDVVCLNDLAPSSEIFMGWENERVVGNAILKFPQSSAFVATLIAACETAGTDIAWGETGPFLLTRLVAEHGLSDKPVPPHIAYPITSADALHLLLPSRTSDVIELIRDAPLLHMWNEVRRRAVVLPWIAPPRDSFVAELFRRHHVEFPSGYMYTADQLERLSNNYTAQTHWEWHKPRIDLLDSMLAAAREDDEILRRRSEEGAKSASAFTTRGAPMPVRTPVQIKIVDYGPKKARLHHSFNPQPNGRSAVWLRTSAPPSEGCRISFDGELLNTDISGCLLTAAIPQPLIDHRGRMKISIVDTNNAVAAGPVKFLIY
jgi:hypothetical protein